MKKECKHIWDESNLYRQPCAKCNAIRFILSRKNVGIGEIQTDWEIKYMPDMNDLPKPPPFPLSQVQREGVLVTCENCGSTMSRTGFLRLFGKRYCDNKKCKNSKNYEIL